MDINAQTKTQYIFILATQLIQIHFNMPSLMPMAGVDGKSRSGGLAIIMLAGMSPMTD